QIRLKGVVGKIGSGTIILRAKLLNYKTNQDLKQVSFPYNFANADTLIEVVYPMGDKFETWDEFNPACYQLDATLSNNKNEKDSKSILFGMRDFKTNGTCFEINGKTIFLRGTVENCDFPLTGYPPEDEASWARVFKICKEYGLNHMRFHSYCPPEAAFIAADKAGIYLQIEGPSWCNHGTSLGNGKPIDKYLYEETERILKEYGNHPSFCMMAYGNEPSGNYVNYLIDWVTFFKKLDPRHLYTGASTGGSWKVIPNSEFMVRAKPRGLPYTRQPQTLFDFSDKLEDFKVPYISHEVGQYCVFPDFSEIKKYTGPLKALNFELFQEDLKDQDMGGQGHDFMLASGKLQVLCYKAEIEAALRTPGFAGFQLLSLNDYSGQGTALVGMLNVFWEEKGYLTSPEFKQFCNQVVPLARIPKFVYMNDETFTSAIEIANFSGAELTSVTPSWKIADAKGTIIAKGTFNVASIPQGNCISLGTISQNLSGIHKAEKLTIDVSVGSYSNNWNIWVYPARLTTPETDIYTCNQLDSIAIETLNRGGKVYLNAAGKVESGKDVVQYFTPVFWNTSWFKMKPPHTTGFLCDPAHPAFADFPTEYHSNFQWWEIVQNAQAMQLDNFPKQFKSILQPIDTWFLNRKLSMIFEAKIGTGKLLVCSADLQSDPEKRPAARQLLFSLKRYMSSSKFNPQQTVTLADIRSIFEKKNAKGFDAHTIDMPDELKKSLK
ncbi:MAG: beta-glucuronidase, partial [Bacteroidia bacterium]|nr:beta-glucuronidase [Bacteroidia bacterium]